MNQVVKNSLQQVILRRCKLNLSAVSRSYCEKVEKTEAENINEEREKKLSGFAKAYEKFSTTPQEEVQVKEPDLPFATLFRRSKLVEVIFKS